MRKYSFHALSVLLNAAAFALTLPVAAFAQGAGGWSGNPLPESPVDSTQDVMRIISNVVKWTYTLFFVAAVFFILVAAYNFVTAGGDKKKVDAAKAQLKYAAIGIAVALLASGAVTLIRNVITDVSGGAS